MNTQTQQTAADARILTYHHAKFTAECIAPEPGATGCKSDDERLGHELAKRNIVQAYTPKISANRHTSSEFARVLPLHDFTGTIALPCGVTLQKAATFAEGSVAEERFSFAGKFAGCLVIVMTGPGVHAVLHGSREALIDREHVCTGYPSREHGSVINTAAAILRSRDINLLRVQVHALFSTPAESFEHPFQSPAEYSRYNHALPDYVRDAYGDEIVTVTKTAACLDLGALCVAQALRAGFGSAIAAHPLPYNGPFADTRHPIEAMRSQRNLIIVS